MDGGKIGPEFTFGLTMDAAYEEPVLIIKTAWGGKSLHTDFRPPSAGAYELNDFQKKLYYGPKAHGVPENMEQWLADKKRDTGHCYKLMIDHVRAVLKDISRVCPAYEGQGYQLAGLCGCKVGMIWSTVTPIRIVASQGVLISTVAVWRTLFGRSARFVSTRSALCDRSDGCGGREREPRDA